MFLWLVAVTSVRVLETYAERIRLVDQAVSSSYTKMTWTDSGSNQYWGGGAVHIERPKPKPETVVIELCHFLHVVIGVPGDISNRDQLQGGSLITSTLTAESANLMAVKPSQAMVVLSCAVLKVQRTFRVRPLTNVSANPDSRTSMSMVVVLWQSGRKASFSPGVISLDASVQRPVVALCVSPTVHIGLRK